MKSVEEVYDLLKKHDSENKLILNTEKEKMELRINEEYKLIAYDNYREVYVEIVLNGKQSTHFHPDYDETYQYFIDVMENRETFPAEEERKEIKKRQNSIFLNFLAWLFLFFAVGIPLDYGVFDTANWSDRAIIVISLIIPTLVIALTKKIKKIVIKNKKY